MTDDEDLRRFLRTAMFILTTWALLCLFLSVVAGCRTSKHITNELERKDSLSVVVNDIRFDTKWFEQIVKDSTWANDYWHIRIYDTTQPIVPETNKPPLAADITHKREQGIKKEDKVRQADTVEVVSKTDVTDVHSENVISTEDVKRGNKTIPAWRLWLFVVFIVSAILLVRYGKGFIYDITTSLLNKIFK